MFNIKTQELQFKKITTNNLKVVHLSPLFLNSSKNSSSSRERLIVYLHIHTIKYTL